MLCVVKLYDQGLFTNAWGYLNRNNKIRLYGDCQIMPSDLHNLRNPRDYLGGTSWKSVILEAHLRKLEMKDCEYDAFFNKIDIEMIEYAFWSEQMH